MEGGHVKEKDTEQIGTRKYFQRHLKSLEGKMTEKRNLEIKCGTLLKQMPRAALD